MPKRDRWVFGRGKSSSQGLYRDLRAATRPTASPSFPFDWPWSRKARERYGKNQAYQESGMTSEDPPSPDEKRALRKNRKKKTEALIEAIVALKEGLVDDAKRNLVAAGLFDADSDYNGMLGNAVLELVKKFAEQGHSGTSAMMTLELFDKVINRRPLTTDFWYEEKKRLLKWLKDEGQLDGEHAMTQDMVDRFIRDSLGPCPRKQVDEVFKVELLIERIESLLERRRAKPQLMYHGTSSKNLRSILKQGLIPDPKKRVWQDDPNAASTYTQITRRSLKGVYLASNYSTASSASLTAAQKSKSERLIVVAQVQPRSGFADEDDISFGAKRAIKAAMFDPRHVGSEEFWPLEWVKYTLDPSSVKPVIKEFGVKLKKELKRSLPEVKRVPLAPKAVEDLFWGLLEQVVAGWYKRNKGLPYGTDRYINSGSRSNITRKQERGYYDLLRVRIERLSVRKGEDRYLDAMSKLTRQLKGLAVPREGDADIRGRNVRMLDPINYRGQNKILSVFEIRDTQDQEGHTVSLVKVHYGKIPTETLGALKQHMGAWKEVKDFGDVHSWWTQTSETRMESTRRKNRGTSEARAPKLRKATERLRERSSSRGTPYQPGRGEDEQNTELEGLSVASLIDQVLAGQDPETVLAESVSYVTDIRLGQNIENGPVVKTLDGRFIVRRAYNRVTGS